jgi:hypothetical protein
LNLREEATAGLARQLIEAQLLFFTSLMDFKATAGLGSVEDFARLQIVPR